MAEPPYFDDPSVAAEHARRIQSPRVARLLEQSERFTEELTETFSSRDWIRVFKEEMAKDPNQEFVTLARITGVPDGIAPLEIREQWVGSVLLTLSPHGFRREAAQTLFREPSEEVMEGFTVSARLAISTLRNDGKTEAAAWWSNFFESQGENVDRAWLTFTADCAEPITLENA